MLHYFFTPFQKYFICIFVFLCIQNFNNDILIDSVQDAIVDKLYRPKDCWPKQLSTYSYTLLSANFFFGKQLLSYNVFIVA
jgi:hypothetical protein